MPVTEVEVEEVGYRPLADPVDDIAHRAAGNQPQARRFGPPFGVHGPDDEARRDRYSDCGQQDWALAENAAEQPEADAGVKPSLRLKNGTISIVRGGTMTGVGKSWG